MISTPLLNTRAGACFQLALAVAPKNYADAFGLETSKALKTAGARRF
jgi:hypothetical protein